MVTIEMLALVIALAGSGDTVLLEFASQGCQPCRTMEPTVRRLMRDGHPVTRIDVVDHPDLASRFKVTGVPSYVMLAGGQEVDRVVGACSHARLLQMLAKVATGPVTNTIRAQSPDAPPLSLSSAGSAQATRSSLSGSNFADRRQRALQATVRVRVDDPGGQSIGTGTIIDKHGDESLVLTCGHIFRDSRGQGAVQIDLFNGQQNRTVEGTLINYDLDYDIGLVSIVSGNSVVQAPVAPAGHRFLTGNRVFSVGCDRGGVPSLRDSQITSIDRYLGPPNIETAGAPADGRSGGGLFSADGFLIGVCNHADPADDEGIYASLPTIHWQLDRIGQRSIYQGATATLLANDPSLRANRTRQAAATRVAPASPVAPTQPAGNQRGLAGNNDTEVICIVRSRSNPQAGQRVYYLNQPPQDLLDRLASESNRGAAGNIAASEGLRSRPPATAAPPRSGDPVVRAQSGDRR